MLKFIPPVIQNQILSYLHSTRHTDSRAQHPERLPPPPRLIFSYFKAFHLFLHFDSYSAEINATTYLALIHLMRIDPALVVVCMQTED